jgi:hypothetical protein
LSTTVIASLRSRKSQPDRISAAIAPARLPYCTAQASTGPATQIPVTGITPRAMADGYCRAAVDSSRPAVTTRSVLSRSLVRRSGRA